MKQPFTATGHCARPIADTPMMELTEDRAKPVGHWIAECKPHWLLKHAPYTYSEGRTETGSGDYNWIVHPVASPNLPIEYFVHEDSAKWMVDKMHERVALLIMVKDTKAESNTGV